MTTPAAPHLSTTAHATPRRTACSPSGNGAGWD